MANLLVTGGAGFIGSNYVFWHLGRYPADKVVVLDALTYASCIQSLDKLRDNANFVFVKGNILDSELLSRVFDEHAIDTVVHFAAESHVDRSISGPDEFIRTNIEGTYTLLKAALAKWVKDGECSGHFHHISTDEVFGTLGPDDPAFCETTQYQPNSPYSASKASSDMLVRSFVHTYGLKASITNCSNNYGPYQFPEKLIPLAITNLLDGKNVPVYGDGRQIRDWLYVEDHVSAVDQALDWSRGKSEDGHVFWSFTLGARVQKTNLEVIEQICDKLDAILAGSGEYRSRYPKSAVSAGRRCRDMIEHVQDRPGHDRRYAIDPSYAEKKFGYKPAHDFDQGIERTIMWYLDNENWWRPLKSRLMDFSRR